MNEQNTVRDTQLIRDRYPLYHDAVEAFRREWLLAEFAASGNNRCALADKIGVHRNTVTRQFKQLGIVPPDGKRRQRYARPV